MAITLVGSDVGGTTGTGTATTVTFSSFPSHQTGDFGLIFCNSDEASTVNTWSIGTATGWTSYASANHTSGRDRVHAIFYKAFTSGSETTPVPTVTGTAEQIGAVVYVFRGVDNTNPMDVAYAVNNGQNNPATCTPPSIAPVTDNGALVIFEGITHDDITARGVPSTPSGMSIGASYRTGGNADHSQIICGYKLDYGSAGTITPTAWTHSQNATPGDWSNWTLALRPAKGYEQTSFRIRDDDGSESAATWHAAANTNFTPSLDTNFRVRFLLTDTNLAADSTSFQLQYSLDGGSWTDVDGSSSYVRSTASSNLTDGADTTQQLGSGTFTSNNDGIDEANGLAGGQSVGSGDETELEFSLQLRSADLACPYSLDLRLVESVGDEELTYTNTPTFGGTGVDLPTPFDDLTTNNWRRAVIGGGAGGTKNQGGIDINDDAAQCTCATASPSSTDDGYSFEFNGTPSAVDMTDEIFIVSHAFNAPNRIQCATSANRGNIFGLHTSDANYKEWSLGGNDNFIAYNPNHKVVIIDPASEATTVGGTSLDITSILYWKKISRRLNISGTSTCLFFMSRAIRCSTLNSGNIPRLYGACADWDGLVDAVQGTGYDTIEHNYVYKVGVAVFVGCPFSIGKSGEATTFNDRGATIVSPASNTTNDPRFHLSPTAMRVYFDSLQTSDTATLSGTYNWGTRAAWNMNTSETITLSNATFTGMGNITMGAGVDGNAIFDDAGSVDVTSTSADLDGSSFLNSFATPIAAAIAEDGGAFTDETTAAKNDTGSNDITLFPSTPSAGNDRYYFGKDVHFTQIEIDVSTAGVGTYTVSYEYYDGSSWSSLTVTDNTNSFKNSGVNTVTFTAPNDWLTTTVNSQGPFFYVRAEIQSGTVTTVPLAETIDLDVAGALVLPDDMTISNMTFSGNDRAIEIEGAGTYTFSNCTFSSNNIDVRNTSGGAVTINLTNGSTSIGASDVENTGAGSITINNNVDLTVTVYDAAGNTVDGVFVSIHQTSDDTELMNETTQAGIATATFNYTSDTAIYIRVRQSTTQATFNTTSGVDGGSEEITTDANHNFEDGEAVVYSRNGGSADIGPEPGTYYVNDITGTDISLHASAADAISDTNREFLTATGGETHTLTPTRYLQFSGTGTITSSGFSLEVTLTEDTTAA